MDKSADYDGISVFLRFSDVDRELSEHPKEREAVELAKKEGWRHALETLYDPSMIAYSADPKRTKFLDLLPLSRNKEYGSC
jgi:hypothetical protein